MRDVGGFLAAIAAACALAACGSSSSSTPAASTPAGGTGSASTSASVSGSCGTIPQKPPADPDHVLAKLPSAVQAGYNLFPQAVHASAWANWKPKHSGPYTIYFSPGNVSTPFVETMAARFNQLKGESNVIGKVVTQDSNNNVQTQIQQIQQAIREHVDIIVALPLSPAADTPVFEAAGKAGIPVIVPQTLSTNRYVIGFNGNLVLGGAQLAHQLVMLLHGKGSILDVHGIPGVPTDSLAFQGVDDVLKHCSDITTAGSVVGQFSPAVAKTQTLEFLSSHPQSIDAAIQTGGMAAGVLQAFLQTGRTAPTIADSGATPGFLAYWKEHMSSYHAVALGKPPGGTAEAIWNVALGLLAGRGVKITDICAPAPIITDKNLAAWVEPGWTLNTPLADAPAPAGTFYPRSYLDHFFVRPAST